MPDIKSELAKLKDIKFDDDPVHDTTSKTEKKTQRELLWDVLVKNPVSVVSELAKKANMDNQFVAASLSSFFARGLVTRKSINGLFAYTPAVDSYPRWDSVEQGKRLAAMKKGGRKNGSRNVKKPKAAPVDIKPTSSFDADTILSGLNVLQARELMDKLKALFGV